MLAYYRFLGDSLIDSSAVALWSGLAQGVGAAAMAVLLLGLQRAQRRLYVLDWAYSFGAFGCFLVGRTLDPELSRLLPSADPVRLATAMLWLAAGYGQLAWLLLATRQAIAGAEVGPRLRRGVLVGSFAAGLLAALAPGPHGGAAPGLLQAGMRSLPAALAFLAAGSAFWRAGGAKPNLVRRLLPAALVLIGIAQLRDFTLSLPIGAGVSGSYAAAFGLLDLLLQLTIGVGMALWTLDEERESAVRDAAAARRTAAALGDSEARYRTLYENSPVMYFIVAADGTVISANRLGAKELGYTVDELVGRPVLDVFHPEDKEAVRHHLAKCLEEPGRFGSWEFRKLRKDASTLWVRETACVAPEAGGRLVFLIVCENVSARKRAEEAEAALRRSETMAAMGDLVAGVAHEVRNPLFSISSNLDAFEAETGGRQECAGTIAVLRTEVGRLTALMHQLLDYGRSVAGEVSPGPFEEIVAEAVRSCTELASRNGVRIAATTADDLAPILMDRGRMAQVFHNLVENAIQHSPPGGVVTVETERERREEGAFIRCAIRDRGPGFPPEDLPQVFEPFFTRRVSGTGLGLSIVQRIVEGHGGTISAGNGPEGGGLVIVRLPCVSELV